MGDNFDHLQPALTSAVNWNPWHKCSHVAYGEQGTDKKPFYCKEAGCNRWVGHPQTLSKEEHDGRDPVTGIVPGEWFDLLVVQGPTRDVDI